MKLVECVPNFSEGRDRSIIDAITGEISGTEGAMLLDVDPVGLVRGRKGPAGEGFALRQYVNDRPYVASSFLSVAIARVLGSALGGRSRGRQELADSAIPLEATIVPVPCRGGEGLLRELFEPLGYEVAAETHVLDPAFPDWGDSRYLSVRLVGRCRDGGYLVLISFLRRSFQIVLG